MNHPGPSDDVMILIGTTNAIRRISVTTTHAQVALWSAQEALTTAAHALVREAGYTADCPTCGGQLRPPQIGCGTEDCVLGYVRPVAVTA